MLSVIMPASNEKAKPALPQTHLAALALRDPLGCAA
jgi:hypothetical protein